MENYIFFFYRHHGLVTYIPKVFPDSYHSFCLWHLKKNVVSKVSIMDIRRSYIEKLFTDCAYATTHDEFVKAMEILRLVSSGVYNYLNEDVPFENWANAYFLGNRRTPGRRRNKRIESKGVKIRKLCKCSRCNQKVYHNRATCPVEIS
ncbi:hypothetical protein IFM89_033671 [Coptis chinensis]|uniref:Protein FAR1-RELATED SEQUENCE n=1 Tax=Coptis chinensis TaxID=261450 RepID=A0A835LPQ0_9MAGN|nr:hypothetical protein IFM89_033671 [Coptis chinensis]